MKRLNNLYLYVVGPPLMLFIGLLCLWFAWATVYTVAGGFWFMLTGDDLPIEFWPTFEDLHLDRGAS